MAHSNTSETASCPVRELLGTSSSGLGHSNPRQKIQYHLKLKQELEELRHEATVLLKERFHLQQCIRCGVISAANMRIFILDP